MKTIRHVISDFAQCSSGTAIIEAAIVLPLAIGLMVGVTDFGRAYATKSAAEKSMRDAARYLATVPVEGVCKKAGGEGWAVPQAKSLALYGNTSGTGTPLVDNWKISNISLVEPTCPAGTTTIGIIHFQASVPFTALMWSAIGLPQTLTMNAEHEERWIGQ